MNGDRVPRSHGGKEPAMSHAGNEDEPKAVTAGDLSPEFQEHQREVDQRLQTQAVGLVTRLRQQPGDRLR